MPARDADQPPLPFPLPPAAQALADNLASLSTADAKFAVRLLTGFRKTGSFTVSQVHHVATLSARALREAVEARA